MADLKDDFTALIFGTRRRIGFILPDIVIQEQGRDELTVTQHPVEKGSPISDHAFKVPVRVDMQCGFSDSTKGKGTGWSRDAYAALLMLQKLREPFSVTTGKRTYNNMLIKSIAQETDQRTEHSLMVSVGLEEVIIVSTSSTSASDQASPESTASSTNEGNRQAEALPVDRPIGVGGEIPTPPERPSEFFAGNVGPAGGTAPT
jgi:hypothetical protein